MTQITGDLPKPAFYGIPEVGTRCCVIADCCHRTWRLVARTEQQIIGGILTRASPYNELRLPGYKNVWTYDDFLGQFMHSLQDQDQYRDFASLN